MVREIKLNHEHTNILHPVPLIGAIVTVFVAFETPHLEGTKFFFTIPLSWTIASFLFQDIFKYHKEGIGLKVFYMSTILKYLVLPVVTCFSEFNTEYGKFLPYAYRYAIIVQDIEIFVSFWTIKMLYRRIYLKEMKKEKRTVQYYDNISVGAIAVIAAAVMLIYVRGIDKLIRHMRFGVITSKLDKDFLFGYDVWLAHCLMAFLVISITGFFHKRNDMKESVMNVILPLISVGLSCLFVFGNNRMMIVYYAMCGMLLLSKAFPKKTKMIISIVIPTVLIVLGSYTMMKQFGIDVSEKASTEDISIDRLESTLAAYTCGTESIAKCYYMYGLNGNKVTVLTVVSDIVHKTRLFELPGLNGIIKMFDSVPTSYSLAMMGSEIVPIVAQLLFFFGPFMGVVFDVIVFYFVIKLLVIVECRAKTSFAEGNIYDYGWLSVLLGMCMCYSLAVIYNNISYVPFFVSCALIISRKIKLAKTRITNR